MKNIFRKLWPNVSLSMTCLQIYQKLLSLATFLWVHSILKEVSYLSWQNTYPNLKTTLSNCSCIYQIFLNCWWYLDLWWKTNKFALCLNGFCQLLMILQQCCTTFSSFLIRVLPKSFRTFFLVQDWHFLWSLP